MARHHCSQKVRRGLARKVAIVEARAVLGEKNLRPELSRERQGIAVFVPLRWERKNS